jgi:squalene-hopene/tetraprenyl-beta-curcumene cyclase
MSDSRWDRLALVAAVVAAAFLGSARCAEPGAWKKEAAGQYLDERCRAWFEWDTAARGVGATRTSCVCCHTLVPFALSRPVLRKMTGNSDPSEYEKKLLAQTAKRVEGWASLDTQEYGLLYDFNAQKKKESLGTEAVLNVVILALDDRYQGRTKPSDITKQAFANLWQAQLGDGANKGSWEWLDFKLEPWESKNARYYGAAIAALALGSAPGYYTPGADLAVDTNVKLLRGYLKENYAAQSLFNRLWALWASTVIDGVLSAEQRKELIAQFLEKQRDDGGWSLSSLGEFSRSDGTSQETASDGYATGLVLHVLQTAGVEKNDPKMVKGLAWLVANQQSSGEWRASSLNKKRDPATHKGKFMADAATAHAVLALGH